MKCDKRHDANQWERKRCKMQKSSFKSNKSIGAFRCELHHCRSRYANAFVTVNTVFSQFHIAAKSYSDAFMRTINHVAHSTREFTLERVMLAICEHYYPFRATHCVAMAPNAMQSALNMRPANLYKWCFYENWRRLGADSFHENVINNNWSLCCVCRNRGFHIDRSRIAFIRKNGTHRMSVVRTSSVDKLSTNANSFVWCRQSSNGAVYTRSNYVMKQSKPIQARNFIHCWNHFNIFIIFLLSKFAVAAISLSIIFVFVVIPFFVVAPNECIYESVVVVTAAAVYRYLITKIETRRSSEGRQTYTHTHSHTIFFNAKCLYPMHFGCDMSSNCL